MTLKSLLLILVGCVFTVASLGQSNSFSENNIYQLDSLAKVYNNKGVDYLLEGNHEKASQNFNKSLKIRESIPNFPKQRLANGYLNLAILKQDMSYIDSAIIYYKRAEKILLGMDNPPSPNLGVIYYAYGDCLNYKQDYKSAVTYIQKGINLLSQDSLANSSHLVLATVRLSVAYRNSGRLDEALNSALNAKELSVQFNGIYLSNVNSAIGLIYLDKKDYNNAVKFFKKAEKIISRGENWRPTDLLALYSNLGITHQHIGQYEMADYYFTKGVKLADTSSYSSQLCMLLRNYALFHRDLGNLEKAEKFFLKSLNLNVKEPTSKSILELTLADFNSPFIAIQCFEGLGLVYFTHFKRINKKAFAHKSFEFFSRTIDYMDEQRAKVFDDGDKLHIDDIYHTLYQNTIQACFSLAEYIPGAIEYAFEVSSKAKAAVLNQAISMERELVFSGVPKDLLLQERELKQRVSMLNEHYHEEKLKSAPSTERLQNIEGRIFDAQREYKSFLSLIESDYPKYFALKYDTTSVSIKKIQEKLKPTQVLIDYIITDSILFCFAVNRDTFSWEKISLNDRFKDSLKIFLSEVNPISFEKVNRLNLESFASASHYLYNKLLKPFEPLLNGRELIIVPHLQLSSIPFAALTTNSTTNPRGYYSLPYLIKNIPISYFSSTKLFYTSRNTERSLNASLVSYAPSYDYNTSSNQFNTLPYRQDLGDLPGAEREANALTGMLNGKLVAGKQATESHFKEYAGEYEILHLAMHTHIDEKNPLFSKLIFSTSTDTTEDGFLNVYEIYGLKLSAKLVIISACRSGDGNLVKGEGLLSLARGFQYAGSPSLVAAQWRVDDFSGSEIIMEFAKSLRKGMSKGKALQMAQLDFLSTSDPLRSHPYFWASYQVIGEEEPIFYPLYLRLAFWVVLIFLVCLMLFGFVRVIWKKSQSINN